MKKPELYQIVPLVLIVLLVAQTEAAVLKVIGVLDWSWWLVFSPIVAFAVLGVLWVIGLAKTMGGG